MINNTLSYDRKKGNIVHICYFKNKNQNVIYFNFFSIVFFFLFTKFNTFYLFFNSYFILLTPNQIYVINVIQITYNNNSRNVK